jgi:hypothetical protein
MTAKEKAQELFLKYYNRIEHTLSIEYVGYDWDIAKTCTLIAVDEIINSNPNYPEFKENEGTPIRYWEVVKQEIEKL